MCEATPVLVTPPSPSGPDVGTLQSGQEHFIPTRFASRSMTGLLKSSLANLPPVELFFGIRSEGSTRCSLATLATSPENR
jgi:hypothetical protein